MNIDFPYRIDGLGRTAQTGEDAHIRDLIEQLLFTNPGERVNRPSFGSGLLQTVFQPNSNELAAALQFTLQASLQQWLGQHIVLRAVTVTAAESTLQVSVQYAARNDQQVQTVQFSREI
jgi:phage baseplate assembly protein W